jgi:F0F1-type ATP synthase assembly protein I
LRLLSMLLYGPVFLGFAFIGFCRSGMKVRLLAIHFIVVMIIGFAIYIEPRYLVTSQLQLIPLLIIGLDAAVNYYKGRTARSSYQTVSTEKQA